LYSDPIVSVLMPVCNAEPYIEEAIESILNQTYKSFEFIICYDESSDNSLKIIKKYKERDVRIVISYGQGRGLIAALNDGLKLSVGRYIARMDADDVSCITRLEHQVRFLDRNSEVGVCGTWVEVFGEVQRNSIWKPPINDMELKTKLLFSVPFAHPSIMMKNELIRQHDLEYNEEYDTMEDYKFWVDISKHTKFSVIPKVLLKYRYLKTSLSKTADRDHEKRFLAIQKVFAKVLEELNLKNTEKENRLHFLIGLNERIAPGKIDLDFLNSYLNKLIEANKVTKVFHQKYLEQYLEKKFLVVIFYIIKKIDLNFLRAFFYKRFWMGIANVLAKKIH
jgi:glycosyltransferase involved in cell wall biosynthesis